MASFPLFRLSDRCKSVQLSPLYNFGIVFWNLGIDERYSLATTTQWFELDGNRASYANACWLLEGFHSPNA